MDKTTKNKPGIFTISITAAFFFFAFTISLTGGAIILVVFCGILSIGVGILTYKTLMGETKDFWK